MESLGTGAQRGTKGLRLFLPFYPFTFLPLKSPLSVYLYEFLEGSERLTRVDALSCNLHTFLNALLALLHHLDTEGCIGENDVLLGWESTVFKHRIKDVLCLFLGSSASHLFRFGNLETEILRFENLLIVVGGNLEVTGE